MEPLKFNAKNSSNSDTSSSEEFEQNTIKVEDFNKELDSDFVKDFVIPYFSDIYLDLKDRSAKSAPKDQKHLKGISKIVFQQYCDLPGIIADRFFGVMDKEGNEMICLQDFVNNLVNLYMSDVDTKIKLSFDFYDF